MNKLSKWDSDILALKPRDLALCRLVYALQLEHRYKTTPKLEQMAKQVIRGWHLSDVAADGIKMGDSYGFFTIRPSKKLLIVSTDLVRIKQKNGVIHRRVHYRKGWEETRIVSQRVKDAVLEKKPE